MISSNDSANSPFGVAYGYPEGVQINNKDVISEIAQAHGMGASSAQLFMQSQKGQIFSPLSLRTPLEKNYAKDTPSDIALLSAGFMHHPSVQESYFTNRVAGDLKKLDTAYRAHGSYTQALKAVSEDFEGAPSTREHAEQIIRKEAGLETAQLVKASDIILGKAGTSSDDILSRNVQPISRGDYLANQLELNQIKRNTANPLSFDELRGQAYRQLGDSAFDEIHVAQTSKGLKRFEAFSDKEKEILNTKAPKVVSPKAVGDSALSRFGTRLEKLDSVFDRLISKIDNAGSSLESLGNIAREQGDSGAGGGGDGGDRTPPEVPPPKFGRRRSVGPKGQFALGFAGMGGSPLSKANLAGRFTRGVLNTSMNMAQASTIGGAVSALAPFGLPIGAITARPLNMLQGLGGKATEMELLALQAQITNTEAYTLGAMLPASDPSQLMAGSDKNSVNYTMNNIFGLSDQLGISPSQSASLLKDTGFATGGNAQNINIAGLTVRGYDPRQVAQLQGQQIMFGRTGTNVQNMIFSGARQLGLRGGLAMQATQQVMGFTEQRMVSGFSVPSNFEQQTFGRLQSMGVAPAVGLATLNRMQGIVAGAGAGLTGMFGGMADLMIQSIAFEKGGGDLFKAQGFAERMSGSPEMLMREMRAMGADRGTIRTVLAGKGLTTAQVRQLEKATSKGFEIEDVELGNLDTSRNLRVSRIQARRQQADLKQLYSQTADGESLVDRFEMIQKKDVEFQSAILSNMLKAEDLDNLATAIIASSDAVSGVTNTMMEGLAELVGAIRDLIGRFD